MWPNRRAAVAPITANRGIRECEEQRMWIYVEGPGEALRGGSLGAVRDSLSSLRCRVR